MKKCDICKVREANIGIKLKNNKRINICNGCIIDLNQGGEKASEIRQKVIELKKKRLTKES